MPTELPQRKEPRAPLSKLLSALVGLYVARFLLRITRVWEWLVGRRR
jgi:hypothetical protein